MDARQLSKIIYREKKKLDVRRFKRLLKRRQDEKANELKALEAQLGIYEESTGGIEKEESDKDYFLTQVEQEDANKKSETNPESEAENSV